MSIEQDLDTIAKRTRYPVDAFLFVQRGLDFTVNRLHGEIEDVLGDFETDDFASDAYEGQRHVSGRDLCMGLRDFAIREYGMLARTVLRRWRVTNCRDFGQIVFSMVDSGLMRKTDDDTIHDFNNVFDFASAFDPGLMLGKSGD